MRERGERPSEAVPPPAAKPTPESPINWWKLDAEEREEALTILFEWVPELVRRYGLDDSFVPPCWYHHEAMVQELLALFQYRNQMQFLSIAPPSAPLDFHYQFQLFLGRMRNWVEQTSCRAVDHTATPIQPWAVAHSARASMWEQEAYEHLEGLSAGSADEGKQ